VEQGTDYKKQLTSIINDPDGLTLSDIPLLRKLVDLYPYFQPLRLILTRLSMETAEAEETLTTTALYTNGTMLHRFLHRKPVNRKSIAIETEESLFEDQDVFEEVTAIDAASELEEAFALEGDNDNGQPEEIDCVEEVNDNFVEEANHDSTDEQETFEEITEFDAHDYLQPATIKPEVTPAPAIETLEDSFVENIAATDFFTFEENFITTEKPDEDQGNVSEEIAGHQAENNLANSANDQTTALSAAALQNRFQSALQEHAPVEKDTSEITNYDDDTLPYTFLWWLAKTRKEHSTIFQPYAAPKKQHPNELQHQYVEHIFHIQSPFNAEEILNNVPERQIAPKDGPIIDAFIKKDPQISAPRPEQIDNENKAKKSAEDHNDLVSETLAKIYIEQMLYHKAIDTYEKLSLKFPEKSRYFADLIQSIKKKI
jgi:hypothetical protein